MRRFVLECQNCDTWSAAAPRFRTSPLVVGAGAEGVPGINAASVQLAEHAHAAHGGSESVSFASVEMPEEQGVTG